MKSRKIVLWLIMLLYLPLFGFHSVRAQSFSITPFLGGYALEGNRNIGKSIIAGFGIHFSLTEKIKAELMYLRGDFDINYYDTNVQTCVTRDGIDTNIVHIGGHYHLFQYNHWIPYVAAGLGVIHINSDYADNFRNHPDRHYQFQLNYGAGLKYSISEDISIRWDLRHLLTPEHMDNDISAIMGISYAFGKNHKKQKSTTQTKYLSSQIQRQSPDKGYDTQISQPKTLKTKMIDSDNDGILDAQDVCPKTSPAVKVDESGCPIDSDKDGVFDGIDRCPVTPIDVAVNIFGCPLDKDRDGVIDANDQCANTPYETPVDQKGCPLDQDRDGIPDHIDLCPETPYGNLVDSKGCVVVVKTLKTFRMKIEFDYKSAEVKPKYHTDLEEAAREMIRYQKAIAIIESHTDNIGSDAYNINLSNQRAESVKNYIHEHFRIPFQRMKTFGFGESRPIADNNTETGRQKNRRVEIVISQKMNTANKNQ